MLNQLVEPEYRPKHPQFVLYGLLETRPSIAVDTPGTNVIVFVSANPDASLKKNRFLIESVGPGKMIDLWAVVSIKNMPIAPDRPEITNVAEVTGKDGNVAPPEEDEGNNNIPRIRFR